MNLKRAKELKSQGLITMNKHGELDLWILKYTNKVTYDDLWTPEIMMCRGLVINEKGIVARPFEKFFNQMEKRAYKPKPNEKFTVMEKMDGSAGIVFYFNQQWHIATQGSFHSEQAQTGHEILTEKYPRLLEVMDKSCTYMFEIIAPQHRIVVDYGDTRDLIPLGKISVKRNKEIPFTKPFTDIITPVKEFNLHYNGLGVANTPNKEGFVVKFESGGRFKVKFEEYMRLHSIVTRCSSYDIWNCMRKAEDFSQFIQEVPDEFYNFVVTQTESIKQAYENLDNQIKQDYLKILGETLDRKKFVEIAKQYPNFGLIMAELDAKNYTDKIWLQCKPEYKKPFN